MFQFLSYVSKYNLNLVKVTHCGRHLGVEYIKVDVPEVHEHVTLAIVSFLCNRVWKELTSCWLSCCVL
jgi:hypothetical protein